MNAKRFAHEAAWELSKSVVRVFAPLLRDEELIDAHREVYGELLPGLEALLERFERDRQRLNGSSAEPPPS